MKKSSLLILATSLILMSCVNNEGSGTTSSYVPTEITSVKDALTQLSSLKNYKFYIQKRNSDGFPVSEFNKYITENYFYLDKEGEELGYFVYEGSIRSFDLDNGEFTATEPLKDDNNQTITSLYDNDLFYKVSDFDTSDESFNTKEVTELSRPNQFVLLGLLEVPAATVLDIKNISITVEDSLESLKMKVGFAKESWSLIVEDIGTADEPSVTEFVNNFEPVVVSDDLTKLKVLFHENNYSRNIYDYNEHVWYGVEHFLPQYFYQDIDSSIAYELGVLAMSQGFLGIDNKTYQGKNLFGCYMFTLDGNTVNLNTNFPYNSSTSDVSSPEFANYPSNLLLWDQMQYIHPTGEEGKYEVTNAAILNDFANNFQVASIVKDEGLTITSLSIELTNIGKPEGVANFHLNYTRSNGIKGDFHYEFFDFGFSNIPAVDQFIDVNNLYNE